MTGTGRRPAISQVASRWWLVLTLTLFSAAGGFAASVIAPVRFRATTSILVGRPFGAGNYQKQNLEASELLTLAYADLALRQPVLDGVVETLGLTVSPRELTSSVKATIPADNSQVVNIVVEASRPDQTAAVATEFGNQLIARSPTASDYQRDVATRDFVKLRLETRQEDIMRGQGDLNRLRRMLTAAPKTDERKVLKRQIDAQRGLLISWQENYSSLLETVTALEPINSLQVIAGPEPQEVRSGRDTALNTLLAGLAGLLLAIGLAYLLELHAHENRPSGPSGSQWSATAQRESGPSDRRQSHS